MAKEKNICQRCLEVVIGIFTKMFSVFKNIGMPKVKEKNSNVAESIFHKEKIAILGYQLKNKTLPIEKRAQAAHKLGLLAFTGGPMAAKWVSDYMHDVVSILQKGNIPPHVKVLLLESMSSWCYINIAGQKKIKIINIIPLLVSFLEEMPENPHSKESELPVKFWSCYLLTVIICNNIPAIRDLGEYEHLKYLLQILASENWQGWPENFAEVLFFLMGYHRD
ncbi:armadillo-like helical domain-containing protein 2 [Dromiciops gliroides]|uniref:armadillo-like helical domain-containing protein 2 n=1 Tax=Dromiciops gliroides TaxID=33562 RepID=UPI001CC3FDC5|nr:armadillo-like helical domain-containing protein 2 [Dromiciops gliroides]